MNISSCCNYPVETLGHIFQKESTEAKKSMKKHSMSTQSLEKLPEALLSLYDIEESMTVSLETDNPNQWRL